jgi:glycosyltransferase involved in cell wall biosynthesis
MLFRLAYIVTHPIQYQAPLFRLLAASGKLELKVFFFSDFSLHQHHEKAFGRSFKWDVNLTDGYEWEVLPRWGLGHSAALRPRWPVRGLKERLKAGHFDAVAVHGWGGHIGLLQALSAVNALGVPILLRGESTPDKTSAQALRRRMRNSFCRKLFRCVAGFLCIGSLNRQFYRSFGVPESKLFLVPYAVDNLRFQSLRGEAALRRETFRHKLGLEPGRPVILFAAKFIPVKAPGDLLVAYQRVWLNTAEADRGMKPYLLFVGDGPLRGELETLAGTAKGTDVRFLGFRNQSEMPAFYDLCDLFVLPSHFEPWGLVINEAMNAGKPVIVSDCVGAAPDLVQTGRNGWIFEYGNVPALADCLRQAITGADLPRMGKRSLEIVNRWDYNADLAGLQAALLAVCSGQKHAHG